MPDAIRRDRWIRVRISTLEEQLFKANAQQAGMEPSAFVRAQVCGVAPKEREGPREEREAGYVSREHHGVVGSSAGPQSDSPTRLANTTPSVASSEPLSEVDLYDSLVREYTGYPLKMGRPNAARKARREVERLMQKRL